MFLSCNKNKCRQKKQQAECWYALTTALWETMKDRGHTLHCTGSSFSKVYMQAFLQAHNFTQVPQLYSTLQINRTHLKYCERLRRLNNVWKNCVDRFERPLGPSLVMRHGFSDDKYLPALASSLTSISISSFISISSLTSILSLTLATRNFRYGLNDIAMQGARPARHSRKFI